MRLPSPSIQFLEFYLENAKIFTFLILKINIF